MHRKPNRTTITDVARAAGVSITTVSHALNDRGQVDPRTRMRIKQAAQRMGYLPNRNAQRLRTGQAHSIVLLSSMPFAVAAGPSRLGFLMEIAAVAAAEALARGLALVLAPPLDAAELPLQTLDIDGALVVEPAADDHNIAQLIRRGLPIVTIGSQPGSKDPLPFVDMHSEATTTLLLEHLRARGARRIGLVIGTERRNSYIEAEETYRRFVRRLGQPGLIARADESGGEDAGRRAVKLLLADDPRVDAICAPVDAFAVGAVKALKDAGRSVPGDVKVATRYDGLRARSCDPPLTAVDLHLDRVAKLAVELLFEHLNGDRSRRAVAGPKPTLVARASSASRVKRAAT